jgi:predicted nucleic acid-binding Zn ribbon protein
VTWRRSPRPIASALDELRDQLVPETLLAEVQRAWPEVVGEAIAGEVSPSAERGGVLTVACSASVWAQELDLMAPTILERLNRRLQRGRIDRLRCITIPLGREPRVSR